jgi:Mce-associated membrane protein
MPTRRRLIAGERRSGRSPSDAPSAAPTPEEVEAAIAADTSPEVAPASAVEVVEEAPPTARSESSRTVPLLVIALAVLTVVALVAFGILAFRAAQASATDRARTAAVAAAREAIVPLLSYDYRRLDADFKKASGYLTGSFAAEYAQTTSTVVRPTATQTHAVVVAQVRTASVVSATPDRVVTLLFVNQTTTSNRLKEPNTDFNRVRITMDHLDGRWLISDIDAL